MASNPDYTTDVRTPTGTVTVTGMGNDMGISSVTISIAVNSFPALKAIVNQPKPTVTGVDTTAVLQEMGTLQKNAFNYSSTNDFFSQFSDGQGNTLVFNGKVSSIGKSMSVNNFSPSIAAAHESSYLKLLNTSIYTDVENVSGAQVAGTLAGKLITDLNNVTFQNYPDALSQIIKGLVLYFPQSISAAQTSFQSSTKIRQAIDVLNNKRSLKIWYDILNNSNSTNIDGFSQVFVPDGTGNLYKQRLIEAMAAYYHNGYSDFGQGLLAICNAFDMMYVPVMSATSNLASGKLILANSAYDNPRTKLTRITYNDITTGVPSLIPLEAVYLKGGIDVPIGGLPAGSEPGSPASSYILSFPDKASYTGGQITEVVAPPWLPNSIGHDLTGTGDTANTGRDPNRIAPLKNGLATQTAQSVNQNSPIFKLLTAYLKNKFLGTVLSGANGMLKTPLDFSWEVGTCYSVYDEADQETPLFTGFCTMLQHNLDTSKSSGCYTNVTFSYVQFPGFSINDLLQ